MGFLLVMNDFIGNKKTEREVKFIFLMFSVKILCAAFQFSVYFSLEKKLRQY